MIDIKVTNAVSKTFEPFIILEFKGQKSILTPGEAIHHALTILENADMAAVNAFLCEYLTTNFKLTPEYVKGVLSEFRQFRERKIREKTNDGSHDDGIGDRG